MTPERAREVLHNLGKWGGLKFSSLSKFAIAGNDQQPGGITEDEDEYIRTVHSMMANGKSYFDAVMMIAEG